MSDLFSIDQISFWIFLIPGFMMVWSFRYFTDSDKKGEFEFLGLSVVCGLLNLILYGFLIKFGFLKNVVFKDLYSSAIILSVISFFIGLVGSQISKYNWLKKIIVFLKSNWFN